MNRCIKLHVLHSIIVSQYFFWIIIMIYMLKSACFWTAFSGVKITFIWTTKFEEQNTKDVLILNSFYLKFKRLSYYNILCMCVFLLFFSHNLLRPDELVLRFGAKLCVWRLQLIYAWNKKLMIQLQQDIRYNAYRLNYLFIFNIYY